MREIQVCIPVRCATKAFPRSHLHFMFQTYNQSDVLSKEMIYIRNTIRCDDDRMRLHQFLQQDVKF